MLVHLFSPDSILISWSCCCCIIDPGLSYTWSMIFGHR